MPQPHTEWTLEMLHALPEDGNRYELIDGELLVSPSPSLHHQRVLARLNECVSRYVRSIGGYETFFAPAAVAFTERRELQPDLLVLPLRSDGRPAGRFEEVGRLLLAVEVISPSTSRNDRYKKRPVYQQEGVPEYWIVDPDARLVERWRPADREPEVLTDTLEWQPDPRNASLLIELAKVFEGR
ncbi:MAG: Uma2 family endonuclease [Gemmatimonadaceae bacterium]